LRAFLTLATVVEAAVATFFVTGVAWGQPLAATVVIAEAELRKLPNTITLVATVEPFTRSVVASEVAGLVEEMPVREGDFVKAGTRIVKLNDDSLRWMLVEGDAQLAARRAELDRWEFELARIQRLADMTQANEKEVKETNTEYLSAKYAVEEKIAQGRRLTTEIAKTEVLAPFDGFVVSRFTEIGEWVDRGGPVVEIIDLANVLVRIDVPESAISYVKRGAPCRVQVDALKRSFDGTVWRIIRQADPDARTFPVEVIVENNEQLLAAGMFARATLISGPEADVLAVPKDAIAERYGVRYVATVFPGERGIMGMLTPVTTGADVEDWIAITAGNVRPGTQVVIRGNERMHPFPSPVNIVDANGTPVEMVTTQTSTSHGRGR